MLEEIKIRYKLVYLQAQICGNDNSEIPSSQEFSLCHGRLRGRVFHSVSERLQALFGELLAQSRRTREDSPDPAFLPLCHRNTAFLQVHTDCLAEIQGPIRSGIRPGRGRGVAADFSPLCIFLPLCHRTPPEREYETVSEQPFLRIHHSAHSLHHVRALRFGQGQG